MSQQFRLSCPTCRQVLRLSNAVNASRVKCPSCATLIQVKLRSTRSSPNPECLPAKDFAAIPNQTSAGTSYPQPARKLAPNSGRLGLKVGIALGAAAILLLLCSVGFLLSRTDSVSDDGSVQSVSQDQAYSRESVNPTYETKAFTFSIPKPWHYAIPENGGKTIATCYLNSKLRLVAKGRFIVDAGKASASMSETASAMGSRMIPKGTNGKVEQRDVKLGGTDAILLTSETKNYYMPCGTIICMHDGRLYMAMLSVSESESLADRDAMINSLLNTWKWVN